MPAASYPRKWFVPRLVNSSPAAQPADDGPSIARLLDGPGIDRHHDGPSIYRLLDGPRIDRLLNGHSIGGLLDGPPP